MGYGTLKRLGVGGRLAAGKTRRFLLVKLRKSQVERQIALRGGECKQCASCCSLVYRCPWLTKDNLCRVYYSAVRPTACLKFPIDQRDIQDVLLSAGVQCGYHFSCPEENRAGE